MADLDLDDEGFDRLDAGFEQTGQLAQECADQMTRLRGEVSQSSREVGVLSRGIETGLRRALTGLVHDGAKLSDVLKGIGRQVADTAFRAATKPVIGAASDMIATGVASVLPFAQGGAFSQGRVMPFAKGGVVSGPVAFPMRGATGQMGEAGPEAIVPLTRGADGRLGVAAQGAARPVSVVFNISTPDVAGFQRSRSQIAAQMGRALALGERNN